VQKVDHRWLGSVEQKPVYTSSSETVEGMKRKRKSKNGRIKERQDEEQIK
jgi:hypothetical protein